jgi:hypothetical protein
MSQTTELKNKALVLEAFDTLFNKRDYVTAERYWSTDGSSLGAGRRGTTNFPVKI